jgi:hypothetical protein
VLYLWYDPHHIAPELVARPRFVMEPAMRQPARAALFV